MDLSDIFDSYSLQARLQPALFVLFPMIITLAIWARPLYDTVSGLFGVVIVCGVLVYLAHAIRARGRVVERQLFSEWGGSLTTRWLSRGDSTLDEHTKARYTIFLESHVNGWRAPTVEEEAADPSGATVRYESAVRWLREVTRDRKHCSLVFKENISYGFRRNLYAVKWLGVAVTCVAVLITIVAMSSLHPSAPAIALLPGSLLLAVNLCIVVGWLFVVKAEWVKDAAESYARALLACCDRPAMWTL